MNKFNELIEKINSEPINESSGGYSKTLDKVISNMESATKSLKEIQSKMDKLKKIKDWNICISKNKQNKINKSS